MKLLSFGELLWDVYPDNRYIGGAPMNFAAHFVKLGGSSWLVSAVGNDEYGTAAIEKLKNWNIGTEYISVLDSKETGKCLVTLNEKQVPTYNLLDDVAYDNIPAPILGESFDVFYFGTLALRSKYNLSTVKSILDNNCFSDVFVDLNIRPPHYSKENILFALYNATIVKISDEELSVVLENADIDNTVDYKEAARLIAEKFSNLKLVIITLGPKGAYVYDTVSGDEHSCGIVDVPVVSTVGAGDSFAAAFLSQYLSGKGIDNALKIASKVSGFVVSQKDAVPDYNACDFS